jgi:enoyl-CoA hydratase
VLGSDVRLASETARFNAAFVRIGLSGCDIGSSWLLPRLIGAARAQLMLLTGRLIDAATAERWGLVAEVLPANELLPAALRIADEIIANAPMGVWMTKEVMWSNLEVSSLQAGLDLENRTQVLCGQTQDCGEAISAFVEKRAPAFQFR